MIQGFISYAHDDGEAFDTLRRQLRALERAFITEISLWADDKLHAGLRWDDTIKARIEVADLFILLLSPAFLDSDYILRHEIPAIRTRVAAAKGLVCPVLLTRCGFTSLVGRLQVVPSVNRRLLAIDEWTPVARGYDEARVQIEHAVKEHFALTGRVDDWDLVRAQPQDPAGPMLIARDHRIFDLDPRGGPRDRDATADPVVRQLYPPNHDKAAALSALVARRANALGAEWADLAPAAFDLAAVLDQPLDLLPDQVVTLWERSVRLASLLMQDKRLLAAPEADKTPLEADMHRALDDLVGSLAPFVRAFPAARVLDDQRGEFLKTKMLFEPARFVIDRAEARSVLTPAAAGTIRSAMAAAGRGDAQAEKEGFFALRGAQNTLVTAMGYGAAFLAGAPGTGYAIQQPLIDNVGLVLPEVAAQATALMADAPADVQAAMQSVPVALEARLAAGPGAAGGGSAPALRSPRGEGRRMPPDPAFWPGGPPSWADEWGTDRYGRWATFGVDAKDGTRVMQRMRWIPPGRFVMGSPKGEEGRFDDRESPQHEVVIGAGFWLADTPCTQALWQAVVGDNPSYFKSPDRPVERVSFDQVEGFIQRLNGLVAGLALELPSEARWEYACRAGTTTATYAGDLEILGYNNAPVLDAIAWYGGNSGLDFDLSNGADSSKWAGKQYPHTRAGTRPVARKLPNDWGLYDMLGNVWDWCADDWHDNYEGAPADGAAWRSPAGSRAGDVRRVIRGGAWYYDARRVRSACRYGYGPEYQDFDLGFRFALVQ